jgi:hypothetical protein
MNHQNEQDTIQRSVEALDDWAAQIDPVQRAKLSAARHRALAATAQGAGGLNVRWLVPACAASLALVMGLGAWHHATAPTPAAPVVATDEFLQDEDLDLLLWSTGSSDDAS